VEEMFKIRKQKAFVSERGERYSSGYGVVNEFGTLFHITKTKKEAQAIIKRANKK